jgi:hypothetical protein
VATARNLELRSGKFYGDTIILVGLVSSSENEEINDKYNANNNKVMAIIALISNLFTALL